MGTQTNVKFSRLSTPIADALAALQEDAFDPMGIELRKLSRIQPTGDASYPGYEAIGKLLSPRTVKEVLDEEGKEHWRRILGGPPPFHPPC